MRGSVASRRVLPCLDSPVASRIPHLRLHIFSRRSITKPAVPPRRFPSSKQKRALTALPLSHFIDVTQQTGEGVEDSQTNDNSAADSAAETQSLEVDDGLEEILQEAQPERVLCSLLYTAEGEQFIREADSESFSSAFASIDPCFLFDPIKDVYNLMVPSLVSSPKYRKVRDIGERFETFAHELVTIVDSRNKAGHLLAQRDCRHLMHCARVLGDGEMARRVWWLRKSENTEFGQIDLPMYNYFMEALCWSNAFSKVEQWRMRVTPRMKQLRESHTRSPQLSGHRTGTMGLRREVLSYFQTMAERGINGDEATFLNLMIAMGREADLNGVKSVLKSVYNIDVDLFAQVDEEELETPTFYELDSPLRPTDRLLHAIVHIFSSNNEIKLAMKLVDYVSRSYDLQIPFKVWMNLLDWSTVLTERRRSVERRQGQAIGQVPSDFFDEVWNQMTDQPHNVTPDIAMYLKYTKVLQKRVKYHEAQVQFESAAALFDERRGQAHKTGRRLWRMCRELLDSPSTGPYTVLPARWFDLRRDFILASLLEDQQLQLLIVTSRRLFTQSPFSVQKGFHHSWHRRFLPNLIRKHAAYLPNSICYRVAGGKVEICGLLDHRLAAARPRMLKSTWNGMLRSYVDCSIVHVGDLLEMARRARPKLETYDRGSL